MQVSEENNKRVAAQHRLSWYILISIILGAIAGWFLYDPAWSMVDEPSEHKHSALLSGFEFLGFSVFMNALKMLIIPLIATSVISAVTSVACFKRLGRLGGITFGYYLGTMLVAVVIGLFLVTSLEPGAVIYQGQEQVAAGVDLAQVSKHSEAGVLGALEHLVGLAIPANIFEAAASGSTLSVITFSLFFGAMVLFLGAEARILVQVIDAAYRVMTEMVRVVLWLAPVGVFSLVAWSIARIGFDVFFDSISIYILTVLIGLAIHALVVLPLLLWLTTKQNPFRYALQMKSALLTAFGTDSSSATLPVTIEASTKEGGVSERVAGLVLPLGATINMDGTALYEAVAVLFMAQAYGIELSFMQLVLVGLTATVAAIGAAGIPSAGLVTMVIVLDVANESLLSSGHQGALIPVAAIGLIIGVDRLLDMFRTVVNVWGDAVGAKIISHIDSKLEA